MRLFIVGAGLIAGVVAAAAIARLVGSFLSGVSPVDPLTYVSASDAYTCRCSPCGDSPWAYREEPTVMRKLSEGNAWIMMRPLLFAVCVVFMFALSGPSAQTPAWQPSPGHTQMPIWPGAVPDAQPVAGPEYAETSGKDFLPGGRPAVGVSNVTRPTITVYSPQGKNTGAAMVVFPGGGYQVLAIDLEGTEVCDWLTPKGITCVLLKYRVTDVGPYPKSGPYSRTAR